MSAGAAGCPLLVAAPLWWEARALRAGLPPACVVRTGMGEARSRAAAARLRAHPAPAFAVAGVCGALDASLAPGDVVVASELLGGDPGLPAPDAAGLCRALGSAGIAARTGSILSVAQLALGARGRRELLASGAFAVDMESAWLAPAAGDRPFAVLRVVSDGPVHGVLHPATLVHGLRALRQLRRAAPALLEWAAEAGAGTPPAESFRSA